ncbi:hypothetical protein MSG28_008741 [Choristoneura fumiferana]|uniref:Uncharacterized protein n=1 Tax=Choristoneura fumiferana TaxID=7141 RepID=A0ACC0J7U6_CHOFU|nr:hypothetical protein MSG28_008741 [Choristoneura fumiferana]
MDGQTSRRRFVLIYRLKAIMEMSQEGLSVLPEESSGRNRMLQTLNTARGISWLPRMQNI